ncbi:hypothetical protein ABWH96_19060 [Marivirga tractuosa]|uniref:M15 family metallopeptidase n=1 Tax=Marivirga tractuosa TaxID=1006 RepID=UPI0035D126BC
MDQDEPDLSEEGTGEQEEGEEDSFDELPEPDIDIEGEIEDVIVDEEDGTITVIDSDGNETEIDPETADENEDGDIVIEDDEGNTYIVDDGGNVSGPHNSNPSNPDALPQDDEINYIVEFKTHPDQLYGFDFKQHDALAGSYEQTQLNGEEYWLAWKSLKRGTTDVVMATETGENEFPEVIRFKNMAGNLGTGPGSANNEKQVTVQTALEEEEVVAYVLQESTNDEGETVEEEVPVGKLKVKSYDKLSQKVVVVPVNGISTPTASTLSNELNRIYGQAVAEWEVVMANNYTSEMSLAGLDDEGSGMLSAYSSAMNDFKREYRRNNNIDRDAYYVFLMSGTGSSKSGYMPFKRQYGFVFSDNTNDLTKTIAHELGHGAFRLRHTFSNEGYIASQGSTNNLMDYSDGTKLYKHQWDLVHDPENVNTLFEDDEEGAMDGEFVSNNVLEILSSSNFLLGENDIKINFNIKNWENYINTTNWDSKNINDFSLIIILTNENNDVLFTKTKSLNQEKKIEWDGELFDNSVVLNSVNDSDFKFLIGIVNSEFDEVDFTDAHISRENTPGTTVLKTANDNSYTTFVDLVIDKSIEVDPAWEDWEEVDEEAQKLVGSSFPAYEKFIDELGNTGFGVGTFLNSVDNPLQYLSDNTVEVEFLQSKFKVLKSFAPKLEYVKEKLGEARMAEIAETCTYTLGIGIRFKKGGNGLSMHSFGTVVDIYPKANLFLQPYTSGKGEKEMIILIKQVTDLDLADHESRTPTKITTANRKFLSEFGNQKMTFDRFVSLYGSIDSYNSSENAYNFKDLTNNTIYNELFDEKVAVESGFFENLPVYLSRVEKLNSFLNEKTGEFTPLEAVVFSEEGRVEISYLKVKIQQLYNMLSPLYNEQVSDSLMRKVFSDINLDEFKDIAVTQLSKEYGALFDIVNSDYENSFDNFALELKKWDDAPVKENFGNKLFEEGFCNVPLDLINVFRGQSDIKWGGMDWNGSNIDYMHFEISESKTVEYLKKP